MKKLFRRVQIKFIFTALAICLATLAAFSQGDQPWSLDTSPLPAPTGFVNDYAGVIDTVTKQQLEEKLKNLRDTTNPSVEISVAVVRTTGDRPIFDYSLAVARGWGIGTKNDDNPSALLFIAIDDRKYFTQVSRNLEDELPDALAGSLQRQYLVPEFRKGNYGKGISDTVDAYIGVIRGHATGGPPREKPVDATRDTGDDSMSGIFSCGIIIFILILIFFSRSRGGSGKGGRRGGGGFGGGGGGSALPILAGILGGMLSGGSSGSSSGNWGGSSGGSDWGGFGGGGDFGGGGAGGDW